jgi:hypothetical protein
VESAGVIKTFVESRDGAPELIAARRLVVARHTSVLARCWVRSGDDRRAGGVDVDVVRLGVDAGWRASPSHVATLPRRREGSDRQ